MANEINNEIIINDFRAALDIAIPPDICLHCRSVW